MEGFNYCDSGSKELGSWNICDGLHTSSWSYYEEEPNTTSDPVNSPSHYADSKIEVIEAIEEWGLTYHSGNVVKYIARAGEKDPEQHLQDLRKAMWYLRREIHIWQVAEGQIEYLKPNQMEKV